MLNWPRRRRRWTLLAVVVAVAVITLVSSTAGTLDPSDPNVLEPAHASADTPRPNIVLVLADDLETGIDLRRYPNIRRLAAEGAGFNNMIVSDSWCCPSRASILRSQYVHSHRVFTNSGRGGGWREFHRRGHEKSTMGTWLQDAGYRTSMIGKYLNHYPKNHFAKPKGKEKKKSHVPPGWDEWHAVDNSGYTGFNYRMHSNGEVRRFGGAPEDYLTDVMARTATDVIAETPRDTPLFLYAAPFVPHLPATPAPRHRNAFPGAKAPRTPSFMRRDFSKEPSWLQRKPTLKPWQINRMDRRYRRRLQSMLAVDDMVGSIRRKLEQEGRLDNTFFVFTSDNGYHVGQHGLPMGKTTAYEEDVRIPMVIRGPGVPAGAKIGHPVSTVDLGPTFVDLAEGELPAFAEGRSFRPLLAGERPQNWRRDSLIEFVAGESIKAAGPDCDEAVLKIRGCPLPQSYSALRTSRYTYVEYITGERQLFDRYKDPNQLNNIIAEADDTLLREFSARLRRLTTCKGAGCRAAEAT